MLRRIVLLVSTVLPALLVSGCGPSQSEIEKSIRDEMKSSLGVTITSLDLKKQSDGSYVGTATAQNGDVYEVTASAPSGNRVEWKAIPSQGMVEKTLRAEIEQQLSSTVTSLQLTKKEPGSYSGVAELANGLQLNVTTHMEGTKLMMKWEPKKLGKN